VKVRFLLDENLPPRLKLAILRLNSEIDILRVGARNMQNYDLLKEVSSFFSISNSDALSIINRWVENVFGITSMTTDSQSDIIVYYF
jgi:hypothetical protein